MIDIRHGNALSFYADWPTPTLIVSDGPYGVSGYDGDLNHADGLASWYEPHIAAWTEKATPQTTLWFWNSELGWAEVHSVLKKHGWIYRNCCIWDKGIAHAAGNSNTKTLRKFPVVSEVCVHYVRKPVFYLPGYEGMSAQEWLRHEWMRTGLPLSRSNEACGVRNAATRKYLTTDHVWYFPPAEIFAKLSAYANTHGDPKNKPYFASEGKILTGSQWEQLRGKFYCEAGITNVWQCPALRGSERIKDNGNVIHPNQKPLKLMELLVRSSTDKGDWIWEPFGGLMSATMAAIKLNRHSAAAEIDEKTFKFAQDRINTIWKSSECG